MSKIGVVSKEDVLAAFNEFREASFANCIWENGLRIKRGNFEYVFNADEINYVGNGDEYLAVSFADEWTNHGDAQLAENILTLSGANCLERGSIELGGRDFQIKGSAFESADDMIVRRKIFELYTSANLNLSLYSSGAGKNLDLLVLCGGTYDYYNFPAILEREFTFSLLWRQETSTLSLKVDGEEIYSFSVPAFVERKTFDSVLVGGSKLHNGSYWKGTITDFKIYDGYAEA